MTKQERADPQTLEDDLAVLKAIKVELQMCYVTIKDDRSRNIVGVAMDALRMRIPILEHELAVSKAKV